MDFFKLKNADQIYFYLDSWCSAGGILEPGTVFFHIFSSIENVKCCKIILAIYYIFEVH